MHDLCFGMHLLWVTCYCSRLAHMYSITLHYAWLFFTMCVCACSVDWLLLASCLCCSSGSIIVSREVAVTRMFHEVNVPALGVLASLSLMTSQCAS